MNTTVVVRSVGEATERACVQLLEEVFGKENVFLVKNVTPFSKAVGKTFEIGLVQNKKWTLAIDADVLIFQDKVPLFIELANEHISQCDEKTFCLEGMLFDKFSDNYREVGLHLFQTRFLEKALEFVEEGTCELRPETFVKSNMSENGYRFYVTNLRLGIHDFFQYPASIVKKAILHCKKHRHVKKMICLWRKNSDLDRDFYWAMKGVEISDASNSKNVIVDRVFMDELVKKYLPDCESEQTYKIDKNILEETLSTYNKNEELPISFSVFGKRNFFKFLFSVKKRGNRKVLMVFGVDVFSFERQRRRTP